MVPRIPQGHWIDAQMVLRFLNSQDEVGEDGNEERRADEEWANEGVWHERTQYLNLPKEPGSLAEIMVNRF